MAWAYFQEGDLRDCRIKIFRNEQPRARVTTFTLPYLIALLDKLSPHALLVPKIRGAGTRGRSAHVAKIVRVVAREAVQRGIAVHVIGNDTVNKSFMRPDGEPARNAQDIHDSILEQFPELTVMVPRPRLKIWEPEQYFTPLFNAIAMYLAWSRQLQSTKAREKFKE